MHSICTPILLQSGLMLLVPGASKCLFRMIAVVAALVLWLAAEYAHPDDYEQLASSARSVGAVSVLVTGWHAITGDEILQGSRGDGPVAITGDEFVSRLRTGSGQVEVLRRYENLPILAVRMDSVALRQAKAYRDGVEVWQDPLFDPLLNQSTPMVGADEAWRRGYSGRGVAVVVIDDGADVNHPFLKGSVISEACFADRCPNGATAMIGPGAAVSLGTHGTHVAGILLGRPDNGLSGVGPDLGLIIINVFNEDGKSSGRNILAALDLAITLGRSNPLVIGAVNMSLGAARTRPGVCRSLAWDMTAERLRRLGIPVVVASGNDSQSRRAMPLSFPACIEGFISVGAVTKSADVATFSNSGPTLDLLAPGVQIRSSIAMSRGGGYQSMQGTSMAAPHVAGALALLGQAAPATSVVERLKILKDAGTPILDQRNGLSVPVIHVGRAIATIIDRDESGWNRDSPSAPRAVTE